MLGPIEMYSADWSDKWLEEVRKLPLKERQRLLHGEYTPPNYSLLSNTELKTKRQDARQFQDFDSHKELCIEISNRKKRGVWE